jgi:hypothetical protein
VINVGDRLICGCGRIGGTADHEVKQCETRLMQSILWLRFRGAENTRECLEKSPEVSQRQALVQRQHLFSIGPLSVGAQEQQETPCDLVAL